MTETTPRAIAHYSEILADEIDGQPVNAHTINEWGEWVRTNPDTDTPARLIQWARARAYDYQRDLKVSDTRATRFERMRNALDSTLYRDRVHLARVLGELYGDQPKHGYEHAVWDMWLRVAYASGILYGYASETHRLAEYLVNTFGDRSRELWREVSERARNSEGSYPEPVSVEEAVSTAVARYGLTTDSHPADPRLSDGWRKIWATAKEADLCEIFDTLALALGVPEQSFTKSGVITVSFYATANVYVDGVDPDDVGDAVSLDDLMENIDRYTIDIQDYDTSELEIDSDD